jgi:hypothetical protein
VRTSSHAARSSINRSFVAEKLFKFVAKFTKTTRATLVFVARTIVAESAARLPFAFD